MSVQRSEIGDQRSVEGAAGLALVPRSNATAVEGRICPGCGYGSENGGYCWMCRDAPVGHAIDAMTAEQAEAAGRAEGFAYFLASCAVMGFFVWEFRHWLADLARIWFGG